VKSEISLHTGKQLLVEDWKYEYIRTPIGNRQKTKYEYTFKLTAKRNQNNYAKAQWCVHHQISATFFHWSHHSVTQSIRSLPGKMKRANCTLDLWS